jgi:uncharacterized membrane protein
MTNPDEGATETEAQGAGSLERLAREVANLESDPKKVEALAQQMVLSERYSGAFPHPAMLKQFGSVVENGAERAFQLTEREQSHRHECERKLIDAEIGTIKKQDTDRRLAIILTFIFLAGAMATSAILISKGHSVGAGLVGGAGVIAAVGALIAGGRRPRDGDSGAK